MKTILKTAVVALFALTFAGGLPQARAQTSSSNVPEPAPKKSDRPAKVEVMGGRITDAGTVFVDDQDLKSWKIANPEAVKDFKNENVRVEGVKDFQRGSITVRTIRQKNQDFSQTK